MGQAIKRGLWLGLLGLGLLVTAAACGGGSAAEQPQAPATAGPVQEVKLAMGDFFYDPNDITVDAGRVRFLLSNVGKTAHRFAISPEGEGVKFSTKNVGAGRESGLEMDLAPGVYKIGCTLGDHEKRGSVGKLTVK